jgi:hypothetical protein
MYQLSRYYRHGELDSCEGRWSDLWHVMAVKRAEREGKEPPRREGAGTSGEAGNEEWRKTFGANVPSEKELAEAEAEILAKKGAGAGFSAS